MEGDALFHFFICSDQLKSLYEKQKMPFIKIRELNATNTNKKHS